MKFPLRFVLVLISVIAAAFLVLAVACGGEGEKATTSSPTATAATTPKASPTAGAAKTPTAGETPEKTPAGEAGELPSISVYPGATQVITGTFDTEGAFPFPLSEDVPVDPEDFSNVQYTLYQTSDSSSEITDFYKKEFKGWKDEGSFGMEGLNGEVMMWSKGDRNAVVWLAVFGGDGATSFVIATGTRQ
jgi:hypothetical protein